MHRGISVEVESSGRLLDDEDDAMVLELDDEEEAESENWDEHEEQQSINMGDPVLTWLRREEGDPAEGGARG